MSDEGAPDNNIHENNSLMETQYDSDDYAVIQDIVIHQQTSEENIYSYVTCDDVQNNYKRTKQNMFMKKVKNIKFIIPMITFIVVFMTVAGVATLLYMVLKVPAASTNATNGGQVTSPTDMNNTVTESTIIALIDFKHTTQNTEILKATTSENQLETTVITEVATTDGSTQTARPVQGTKTFLCKTHPHVLPKLCSK
ncbi:unnamed protein product [Owenia fusiformis]|uniref:Uncharacterized protein n=1 Tax=Owenia fusiformis TaxID=6347 RepID=A0A8S4QBN2_OWEFU|nr:unnamed protein product [Owenia fusiformis]